MAGDLEREVGRLAERLAAATPRWYAARPAGARTRAQVLRELVAELGRLGAVAGTGQPPDAVPPALGDHALADQLVLLAAEIAAAPDATRAAPTALAAVRAARGQLEVTS